MSFAEYVDIQEFEAGCVTAQNRSTERSPLDRVGSGAIRLDRVAIGLDRVAIRLDRVAIGLDRVAIRLDRVALARNMPAPWA
jgi:hypothetical protein